MDSIFIFSVKAQAKSEYFTKTYEHQEYMLVEINQSHVNVFSADDNLCKQFGPWLGLNLRNDGSDLIQIVLHSDSVPER